LVVDVSAIPISDLAAAIGNVDFGGFKGVNVADPTLDQDAVTKKYFVANKYTDGQVNAIVLAHTAIADAHHTNHENAQNETGTFNILNAKNGITQDNTPNPGMESKMSCIGVGGYAKFLVMAFCDVAWRGPYVQFLRSRGSTPVKTLTLTGDKLGVFQFYGVNGLGNYGSGGVMEVVQEAACGAGETEIPSIFNFKTANGVALSIGLSLNKDGWVCVGPVSATSPLDIAHNRIRIQNSKTPATAGAAGLAGEICWDANYIYTCVATNTWKRAPISTW